MAVSQKLVNLEKKLGLDPGLESSSTSLMEELGVDDISVDPTGELVPQDSTSQPAVQDSIISVDSLQRDFEMAKSNVKTVMAAGQRILVAAGTLDLADLKASQLDALSNLQNTVVNSTKTLLELYKDVAAIEKSRQAGQSKLNQPGEAAMINTGTVTNNNIVLAGTTKDVLDILKKAQQGQTIDIEASE